MASMRVFVSHSSHDSAPANELVNALRAAGADVWYDEHNFSTGQVLDAITEQLRSRPVFIVLLSPAAFASEWVRRECKWAYSLYSRDPGRIILPVVVSPVAPSAFDEMLFLEDFKRIEAPAGVAFDAGAIINQALRLLALAPTTGDPQAPPEPAHEQAGDLARDPAREQADELLMRAKALLIRGESKAAAEAAQQASSLAPDVAEVWRGLAGVIYVIEGRELEALAATERALALNPHDANAWIFKAATLWQLGREEEAQAAVDRACELDPHAEDIWRRDMLVMQLQMVHQAKMSEDEAKQRDTPAADAQASGKPLTPTTEALMVAVLALVQVEDASDIEVVDRELAASEDDWWTSALLVAKACLFARFGREAEAQAALDQARTLGLTLDMAAVRKLVARVEARLDAEAPDSN